MRDGEFLEKDEQKRKDRVVVTKMQNSVPAKRMTRNGVKFVQLVKWRGFLTKSGGKTRRT